MAHYKSGNFSTKVMNVKGAEIKGTGKDRQRKKDCLLKSKGFPIIGKKHSSIIGNFAYKLKNIMAKTSSCTFLTCYYKNEKVVDQHFLNSPGEVKTLEALGRSKGYEVETFAIEYDYAHNKCEVSKTCDTLPEKAKQPKRPWNKWIRCVETGQLFPSVKECSIQLGLPYKSVWNAINNGFARDGMHFVFENKRCESYRNYNKPETQSRKILCVTTGVCYQSVKECLQACQLPATSFYRALNNGSPIKGLVFRYV